MKHTPEEKLIWEAYVKEDLDLSDVGFKGDDEVRDLAKISPEELEDEEFIEDDDEYVPEEGDVVSIDKAAGGGAGEVIELSPSGTHAIIKLIKDQETADLEKGDRVSIHVGELKLAKLKDDDEDDFVKDDDEDDVSYEGYYKGSKKKKLKKEGCGCGVPDDIVGEPESDRKLLPKAKLPGKVRAIIVKHIKPKKK